MAQVLQVQGLPSSTLGRFQGPAWIRSSRYKGEPSSSLKVPGPEEKIVQEPQVQVMNPTLPPHTPLGISRDQLGSRAPGTAAEP
jgi:hypothetical protein